MSEKTEIVNAKIGSINIGFDRGVFLSAWIYLDYGGSNQGFGGFVLAKADTSCEGKGPYAGHFISRCLEIGDVDQWEKLKGKTVRVKKESQFNGKILAIGHIIKDDWFSPSEDFQQHNINLRAGK